MYYLDLTCNKIIRFEIQVCFTWYMYTQITKLDRIVTYSIRECSFTKIINNKVKNFNELTKKKPTKALLCDKIMQILISIIESEI